MKSPEILNANDMTPVDILHLSKCAVNLSLKSVSSARAEMPIDNAVDFGTWVRIYYPNGESGVFRASIPEKNYDSGKATVTFDNGTKTLADNIVNVGDTYDENNVSETTYFEGSATEVFNRLLSYQKKRYWNLGTVETTEKLKLDIDYDNLLSKMNEAMQQIPDCYIAYDQSTFPWIIHIRKYPTTVKSEGRLSRNVRTARVRYDDSDLITRVYCESLPSGHMDSANVNRYGIREGHYYLSDVEDSFAVKACKNYLDLRDKPKISVDIEGADFSEITGVSLDKILLGDLYRLVIPERGLIVEEQITGINYTDICNRPYELTVSLSKERDDLSSALAAVRSRTNATSGAVSKGGTKVIHVYDTLRKEAIVNEGTRKVLHEAGIEYDENHVMLFARELGLDKNAGIIHVPAGQDYLPLYASNTTGSQVKGRIPDGTQVAILDYGETWSKITYAGITGYVQTKYLTQGVTNLSGVFNVTAEKLTSDYVNRIAGTESHIEQTAEHIRTEIQNTRDGLESSITQTAGQIRAEVKSTKEGLESSITQTAGQIRSEVKSTKEGLETQIKQNKDSIELTVKKGDVATQLAVEAGNVSVRNGNLIVEGMVTAKSVKAAVANISDLTVGGVIRAQHYYLGTGAVPTAMIDSGTYDVRIMPSGNNYILQKQTYSNFEWQDVSTFSRATSLSGAWSGSEGRFVVTASPQGETYPVKVSYSSGFTPPGQSKAFNVIRPSASGYDWLRVWQQVGPLDTSTGIRTVKTFAGSSPVEQTDITDYNTGYDAVSAPSISFTAVDARATGNPSGTASIANKTGGGTRRTSIGMTMSRSVFSPTGGETERCVNVSYNNTTVGRISVQADYNAGYTAGDSDGYTRGYRVTDGDISISVDSDAHTSRGDRVEIWSSRPGFANQAWYYFDVTVHGNTKEYAIYMKRA